MDAISLAFGAIFVVLGLVFLTDFDVSTLEGPETWTAALAVVGVLLLGLGARRQNR
jgi:MYXO-CTERM domain-containing protein